MNLMRLDPYRELATLQERLNRTFGAGVARSDRQDEMSLGAWAPPVDIAEEKDRILITAELPGFASMKRENLELLLGQRVVLDFRMALTGVAEAVTVTGAAPLIDITQSRVGGNIDTRQMQVLPINGRDYFRESEGLVGNMNVGEAVRVAVAAGAHTLVPMHWDLFQGNTASPGSAVEEAVALGAPLHVLTVSRMVPFSLPPRPRIGAT